ncbi:PepSY domain-containing protein [Allobacillus sp. GCM10007491]|uniref:PepSY domain-containing protein n=1 Tax=Allobacillus saliphilus TaxID=2912308 RepID=A0A941CVT2_9BACI|nr:PepSY domain-containing protein [Allobacillus saliphilus]MBR7554584.1 PepSY domain-containing protein [Allobacillus saliphilus]
MNKERIFWMAGGSILTITFFLIAQQFLFGESSAEELSVGEVKERVEERFQAKVLSIEEKEEQFEVKIEESNGKYLVFVDSVEGQVLNIQPLSDEASEKSSTSDGDSIIQEGEDPPSDETNENNPENESGNMQENKGNQLTLVEAEKKVKQSYKGEITSSEFVDAEQPYIKLTIDNDYETIQIHVDAKSGELSEQKRVSKEQSKQEDPAENESPQQTLITKKEAGQIALDKISGELEDIELKEVDGTAYYHVEVERKVDDEDEDYVIRINAITGKVISVSKDD